MKTKHRNPLVTVDIIIEMNDGEMNNGILLVERKNPPYGWALPGGFVDYGESLETAAVREAREETSLDVTLLEQFHTYSAPDRDPRQHTVTTVYIGSASGIPMARDDAKNLCIVKPNDLPDVIAFDHAVIIQDYFIYRTGGKKPDLRVFEAGSGTP